MIKNKKFLITGHTSGLGRSLNKILLENKNTIIGISKSKSKIRNFIDLQVDFSNLKILNNKLKKLNKINKIDYLILNAGLLGDLNLFSKVNFKKFERILNVNFLSNKIIIDYFLSKKVKIKNVICISSGAALKTKYAWGSYCISKAATKMMIETYAEENNKINFINLSPGLIKTKMQKKIFNTKQNYSSLKKFKTLYKNNLIDTPDKVAFKIIKFLAELKKFKDRSYVDLRNV